MDPPAATRLLAQPARFHVMAALHRHRDLSFAELRGMCGLTDGNLASHARRLEEAGWLERRRVLLRTGFSARLRITPAGAAAFVAHARWLLESVEGAGHNP